MPAEQSPEYCAESTTFVHSLKLHCCVYDTPRRRSFASWACFQSVCVYPQMPRREKSPKLSPDAQQKPSKSAGQSEPTSNTPRKRRRSDRIRRLTTQTKKEEQISARAAATRCRTVQSLLRRTESATAACNRHVHFLSLGSQTWREFQIPLDDYLRFRRHSRYVFSMNR